MLLVASFVLRNHLRLAPEETLSLSSTFAKGGHSKEMESDACKEKLRAAGDFVLDESLEDEDEEVLAFEASRQSRCSSGNEGEESPTELKLGTVEVSPSPIRHPFPNAVVVDRMPPDANRTHLDSFLQGCGDITGLKLFRFPNKTFAARVEFADARAAELAVERNGEKFAHGSAPVAVYYAPSSWEDLTSSLASEAVRESALLKDCPSGPSTLRGAVMVGSVPVNLGEVLPDAREVKTAFWGTIVSAKKAAEAFEQRARNAGADFDSKFHVAEQVGDAATRSKAALNEMNEKYSIGTKLGEVVEAGKEQAAIAAESAKELDESFSVSKRVGDATARVTQAGAVAAQEVDENLRISERARAAANAALENDQVGPLVKSTMTQLEGLWINFGPGASPDRYGGSARRRKMREPSGIEQDAIIPTVPLEISPSEDEDRN